MLKLFSLKLKVSDLEYGRCKGGVYRAAIEKWGYAAARLRADAAIILAIAAVIELGLVREDPTWRASKIHEAVDKASDLL